MARTGIFLSSMTASPPSTFFSCAFTADATASTAVVVVGIPTEIDEAARIDGCNAFQSFIRVMLPMSANGLAVTFVFSFLFGYQDMMYSLTYVTDSAMWPVTTGIYNVVGRYGVEWCRAMAFGCMAVLPVILIFVFMQKYIVQGLTAGAVKG